MTKDIWWASLLVNSNGQWLNWQMSSLVKHISGCGYEGMSKDSRPVGRQLRDKGLPRMWAAPIGACSDGELVNHELHLWNQDLE